MLGFIVQAVVTAIGLWASAKLVPGVEFTSTGSLIAAAVILGVVNAFVLFLLVVNAAMIGLTAMFLGGFVVDGLWAGIGAAIVTGVVSWIAGALFGGVDERR
jgi:putative membrane protein